MEKKQGITLIYLVITIVVMLILVATVVTELTVSASDAKLSAFANDILQVQDSARAQYILNNAFPYATKADGSAIVYTMDNALAMVGADKGDLLKQEFIENKEPEDVVLYELDLDKLEVDKKNYGNKENGEDDIYVISNYTQKVYYLRSIKYNRERYFSYNDKVAGIVKTPVNTVDTSSTSLQTYEGVSVTKNNAQYTNKLGVKIIANMRSGETLKIAVDGIAEMALITTTGTNVIEFDDFYGMYVTNNANPPSGMAYSEALKTFNGLRGDKRKLILSKYSGATLVAKYELKIDNYDNISPSSNLDRKDIYESMMVLGGQVQDESGICVSGVAQIRYEFRTKLDGSPYGDTTNFDDEYMKTRARQVEFTSDYKFSIKTPLDVGSITLAVIDKAGNISKRDIPV